MFNPVQNFTNRFLWLSIIGRIILEIELFSTLNSFAGAVKTKKTYGSSIPIPVSGGGKNCHSYNPYVTVST